MKPTLEEFEVIARSLLEGGGSDAEHGQDVARELERLWSAGYQEGLGLSAEFRANMNRPARPDGDAPLPPNRTPEQAAAIEKRLEAEIGALYDRMWAALVGHGESVFARFVVVQVMSRVHLHLMDEDPQVISIIDEPTRRGIERAVEHMTGNLIAMHRAALVPHQN